MKRKIPKQGLANSKVQDFYYYYYYIRDLHVFSRCEDVAKDLNTTIW